MLTDLAVAIADGATTIGGTGTLGHQGDLFGLVASDTTAWWTLAYPTDIGRSPNAVKAYAGGVRQID